MQVEDTFSLYVSMSALAERRTDVGDRMVFCIHDLGRRLRVRKQQSRYENSFLTLYLIVITV